MSRKTESAYKLVLKAIFDNLLPSINPLNVMSEFETALQNGLRYVFPDAVINGCFLHHGHVRKEKKSCVVLRELHVYIHFLLMELHILGCSKSFESGNENTFFFW